MKKIDFSANLAGKRHSKWKKQREADLQRRIIQKLTKIHSKIFLYKVSDLFQCGLPDLIGCIRGVFFAMEIKVAPNKPTILQKAVIRKIIDSGGFACVVWSVDDAVKFLRKVEESY